MAATMKDAFLRAPSRLFGLHRETRQPGAPLKITQDTTVWEICNHEAENIDRERIKDWNDSLNTLLIFVREICIHPGFILTLHPRLLYTRGFSRHLSLRV